MIRETESSRIFNSMSHNHLNFYNRYLTTLNCSYISIFYVTAKSCVNVVIVSAPDESVGRPCCYYGLQKIMNVFFLYPKIA